MLIDPAMLHMLKELRMPGQPDPIAEILTVFEAVGHRMLARMRLACDNQNTKEVHEAAHRMKGSAANLGAVRLQERLGILETQTKSAPWTAAIPVAVAGIPELFEASVVELRALAHS